MSRPRKPLRRGRGEGTTYEKVRRWTTADGKVHEKRFWVSKPGGGEMEFVGATAQEARERRDAWLREHGKPVPRSQRANPTTVKEFSDTFLADRKANKRYATYRDYETTLRLHILPFIGSVKLSELADNEILAMYEALKSKVSPSMCRRAHVTLRALINYGLECKELRASPLATIKQRAPKQKKSIVRPLDDSEYNPEIARLLKAVKGNRLESLFLLAIDAGMRQGELFALEWSDIDLGGGKVHVRRAASETDDGIIVDYCKTDKSERSIDISPDTIKALRQRRIVATREGLGDCRLVFPSEHGCIMRKSNFSRRVWEPIRKEAGIPQARFHSLRHTCAVLLLKANVHPKIVSERLGHASIVITMDCYSAWIPNMQAKAAEAMADILGTLSRQKHLKAA